MRRLVLGVAALVALAAPAAAGAAQITAGPAPSSYQNPMVEIEAGEAVTFMNLDLTGQHDVTSTDIGAGARPLFRSQTVGFGTTVPVEGAEALGPGSYGFLCSIHTFMTGSITVRGGGGAGGGEGPSLKLTALDRKLAEVERAGKLRFRAKLGTPATVRVAAASKGSAKVASGRAKLGKGTGPVSARLTSKGKRLVSKARRLPLEVTARATDADGNSAKQTLQLTLR